MSLCVRVTYPKRIVIEHGREIEITGRPTSDHSMLAHTILDGESGVRYQLHPDEIPEMEQYKGAFPWEQPLVGTVLYCLQYGEQTNLDVWPSGKTVYDYGQSLEQIARGMAPGFWAQVQSRDEWQRLVIPDSRRLRDSKRRRTRVPANASELLSAASTLAESCPEFRMSQFLKGYHGCQEKLANAERWLYEIEVVYEIRRLVYEAHRSDGREWVLGETRARVAMTVESLLSCLWSALDILGYAINQVCQLGIEQNRVSFLDVLECRTKDNASPCLANRYAESSITRYLQEQRAGWVAQVEGLRHYAVHGGSFSAIEVVGGGVELYVDDPDMDPGELIITESPSLGNAGARVFDALSSATQWVSQLRRLLDTVFGCMAQDARAFSNQSAINQQPTKDRPKARKITRAEQALDGFLSLWKAAEDGMPNKYEFAYQRLSRSWREEWSYDQFHGYIESRELLGTRVIATSSMLHGSQGRNHGYAVEMEFHGTRRVFHFSVAKEGGGYKLVRTPLSTLPSSYSRVCVLGIGRRQSGREHGRRDLIYSGSIKNLYQEQLEDVQVHVFLGMSSQAVCKVGVISPGAEAPFEAWCRNAFVAPDTKQDVGPISGVLLRTEIRIRVTYKSVTSEGTMWAEDIVVQPYHFGNR